MPRKSRVLKLNRETVRQLTDREAEMAVGGAPTLTCTFCGSTAPTCENFWTCFNQTCNQDYTCRLDECDVFKMT